MRTSIWNIRCLIRHWGRSNHYVLYMSLLVNKYELLFEYLPSNQLVFGTSRTFGVMLLNFRTLKFNATQSFLLHLIFWNLFIFLSILSFLQMTTNLLLLFLEITSFWNINSLFYFSYYCFYITYLSNPILFSTFLFKFMLFIMLFLILI